LGWLGENAPAGAILMVSLFRVMRFFATALLLSLLALVLAAGLGVADEHVVAMRRFAQSVRRWQVNPDFRPIATQYASLGYEAMRTRVAGIAAADLMMAVRSIPGLPERYAAAPTSRKHYDNFSGGPLSAYLHLMGEQHIEWVVESMEGMAAVSVLSDEDIRTFLGAFAVEPPVVRDDGAVASVRRLLADIRPEQPLKVRREPQSLIGPAIAALADRLGIPADPRQMTPQQQAAVLAQLDEHLRLTAWELWRAKQVADFGAGIWAQVYGQNYSMVLVPVLCAVRISRPIAIPAVGAVAIVVAMWRPRARRGRAGRPMPRPFPSPAAHCAGPGS